MGFNPFSASKPAPSKPSGGFDVDEMVRRIDAKIAELEEEERREKEKLNNPQTSSNTPDIVIPPSVEKTVETNNPGEKEILNFFNDIKPVEKSIKEEAMINIPVENNVIPQSQPENIVEKQTAHNITEDQFFDDFFFEDE